MALNSGLPVATPNIPKLPAGSTYAVGTDGKVYIKTATQNANGQWVQTVSTITNGVLIPLLNALFPNGVTPNQYGNTTLPNGATIGGFQEVGGGDTGGGSGDNNNTLLIAGVGVAAVAAIFLTRKTN